MAEMEQEAPLSPAMARLESKIDRVLKNAPMLETLAADSRHRDEWEQYRRWVTSAVQRAGVVAEPRRKRA